MKAVNQQAEETLNILTAGLEQIGDNKNVDNAPGVFMSVTVEIIWKSQAKMQISVAHYYEQNGDLMRDPEMVFLKRDGKYYPFYFRMDGVYGREEESVVFDDTGDICKVRYPLQKQHAIFAGNWMENIKEQQNLYRNPMEPLDSISQEDQLQLFNEYELNLLLKEFYAFSEG